MRGVAARVRWQGGGGRGRRAGIRERRKGARGGVQEADGRRQGPRDMVLSQGARDMVNEDCARQQEAGERRQCRWIRKKDTVGGSTQDVEGSILDVRGI
jgi:hypothetical protein